MTDSKSKLPVTFWIIAVIGLVWNLLGVLNFFGQTLMSEEAMAALPEEQQTLLEAVPAWMTLVFAIAVFSGTLGCIGLILKKGWAETLFLISLIAVVIQVSYNLFVVKVGSVLGPSSVVVTLLILIFALFLYFYTKRIKARGWLA